MHEDNSTGSLHTKCTRARVNEAVVRNMRTYTYVQYGVYVQAIGYMTVACFVMQKRGKKEETRAMQEKEVNMRMQSRARETYAPSGHYTGALPVLVIIFFFKYFSRGQNRRYSPTFS